MLRIDSISYSVEGRPLFEDASATIPEGHKVGLVGPNGAGKTTLFRLIRGELTLDNGEISLPSRARIGGVSQEVPSSETSLIDTVLEADAERAALQALLDTGLTDAFTRIDPPEQRFTWWDYRQGGFRRGLGLRIDHHLISEPLLQRFDSFAIDIEPRRWERPSDHTPVVCGLR